MNNKNIDPELEAYPRAAAAAAGVRFEDDLANVARAQSGPALRRLARAADRYETAADIWDAWAAGKELLAAARGVQHVVDALVATAPADGQVPQP